METFLWKNKEYEVATLEPSDCFAAVYEEGQDAERVYWQVCRALGIDLMLWPSRVQQIQTLKENLVATDYIALKAFEGQDVSAYPDWKEKRQTIRDEINRLEQLTDDAWNAEKVEEWSE